MPRAPLTTPAAAATGQGLEVVRWTWVKTGVNADGWDRLPTWKSGHLPQSERPRPIPSKFPGETLTSQCLSQRRSQEEDGAGLRAVGTAREARSCETNPRGTQKWPQECRFPSDRTILENLFPEALFQFFPGRAFLVSGR